MINALMSLLIVSSVNLLATSATSATLDVEGYEYSVIKSAEDDLYFQNFRQNKSLKIVYEHVSYELGILFAKNLLTYHRDLLEYLPEFRKNDLYGNPSTYKFRSLGAFSPVTLRYIHFLGEINKMFDLPNGCKIAEVGVGYGGQCSIISRCINFSRYELIDLPFVLPLVKRYLNTLNIDNFITKAPDECGGQMEYDLFISNYAISECDRKSQDEYIEKVIAFCKRGYIVYNRSYNEAYDVFEFCDKLKSYGIMPLIREETIQTDLDQRKNVVIYWGSK